MRTGDPGHAADTYAALCNIGVYQVLIGERGWTVVQVETWWIDALAHLLVADAVHRGEPERSEGA